MLTMRIQKNPTLYTLQCPFEASLQSKWTWYRYAMELERMVKFLGKDRRPDDVFSLDVKNLRAHLEEHYNYPPYRVQQALSIMSSYYQWMRDMGFASANPFDGRKRKEIEVILE